MRFVVLHGKHTDEKGRTWKKGETVESDLDLTTMFVNKFRPLDQPETAESAPTAAEAADSADKPTKKGSKPETADAADARGTDKTESFPKAAEEGFTVFQREKAFHVYEGKDVKPINPKGLKKDEVEDFVVQYLKE